MTKYRLWKLGSLEHKIVPTKDALEKLRKIIAGIHPGGVTDIVWGPDITLQEFGDADEDIVEVQRKTALIFGMGQDGMYLAPLLLSKGYRVLGAVRRSSQSRDYLSPLIKLGLEVIECDITDAHCVSATIEKYKPEYVYNLAAMSHVHTSFSSPASTFQIDTIGVLNILEAIRTLSPKTRMYQAGTSEMFGKSVTERRESVYNPEGDKKGRARVQAEHFAIHGRYFCGSYSVPEAFDVKVTKFQNEETSFIPQSPYAIAKLAAHESIRLYREAYGLFACSGILFNHESEHRGANFVTRKITRYIGELVARCKRGEGNIPKLKLGNLDAFRDWSHAEDMVKAMVLILEAETPTDYVVGSGETHTVREFCDLAFKAVNLNWEDYVEVDPEFKRPAEVEYLCSDPSKIKRDLGWSPSVSFQDLVERMVRHDVKLQMTLDYLNA